MRDSKTLEQEAVEAEKAAQELRPSLEEAKERLSAAEEALARQEAAYNLSLEAYAQGVETDVSGAEGALDGARKFFKGLSNLAGRLANEIAGHRDNAEALRQASLEAFRAERAAQAMRRLPELVEQIRETQRAARLLSEEFEYEKGILLSPGPWAQEANAKISACNRKLRSPEPMPPRENRGERTARELRLNEGGSK